MPSRAPEPRHTPSQARSRTIVSAIVEAGRRLLVAEGPQALTTNRIAERAGVSIGSLYRYFENKEAIVAAICEGETGRELDGIREAARWEIEDLPLGEALARLVDFQLERHRRLLGLGGDHYRARQHEFSLTTRVGSDTVERRLRELLLRHRERVRVRDAGQAAFVIARGISAIVRRAVDERPEKLAEPAFRDELVDLLCAYVLGDPPRPPPAA